MKFGDPEQMSNKARADGHNDVLSRMDPPSRALTLASGTVADSRRLVTFVYLLLRDAMPCGTLATVMRYWHTMDAPRRELLFSDGLSLGDLERAADQLTDTVRRERAVDWLALVFKHAPSAAQVKSLLELVPAADDVETVFSNGWVAEYAKRVVAELECDGEEGA